MANLTAGTPPLGLTSSGSGSSQIVGGGFGSYTLGQPIQVGTQQQLPQQAQNSGQWVLQQQAANQFAAAVVKETDEFGDWTKKVRLKHTKIMWYAPAIGLLIINFLLMIGAVIAIVWTENSHPVLIKLVVTGAILAFVSGFSALIIARVEPWKIV